MSPASRWVNRGPVNVTGRIGVLAIHPTNGDVLYAGSTGGGVWKTTNGGSTWRPMMHDEQSLAIGGLGVAASRPAILYAATGEWTELVGLGVDPIVPGVGVYRTSNGGTSWTLLADITSRACAAVAVDPTNPNRVFVAGQNGLHRSRDGGKRRSRCSGVQVARDGSKFGWPTRTAPIHARSPAAAWIVKTRR